MDRPFLFAKQSAMRIICRNGNHSIWGNRVLGILKMSGFELLYNLVRIQYIIDLVWVSMTAFFMSRAEANDLRDCIDVSTGKCFFYEREALKWILLLWGVWNIIAIVTLLIGSYRNDAIFALSANWFLRGYLMNIALPQLICILAAAAFVRASHKIAAGFLLILFLFLISHFENRLCGQRQRCQ